MVVRCVSVHSGRPETTRADVSDHGLLEQVHQREGLETNGRNSGGGWHNSGTILYGSGPKSRLMTLDGTWIHTYTRIIGHMY